MSRFTFCTITGCLVVILSACGCSKNNDDGEKEYTVTFDTGGGAPTPAPQKVPANGKITDPGETPAKTGYMFAGWYTASGERVDIRNTTVNADMTVYAKWWNGPEQFIFINGIDLEFNYAKILNLFGRQTGKQVAVGQSFILYCFERPREVMLSNLHKHLAQSQECEIPILVQLDAITFMDARPDLWNWWDASKAGYNPDNKENVEWTSWSSDDAVKIGWLNWGSQIRLNPMPNLMSPAYRQAVDQQMGEFIAIVLDWYQKLPHDQKWLFAGIKVTGEMAIGVNNWYYPDGNSYLEQPSANDPQTGINIYNLPSRGVQTIGYAALQTGGFKSSGSITGDDITLLAQRHSALVSKLCADAGIPREKIFAHAGGVGKDLEACINSDACPSWSFYSQDAVHPAGFTDAFEILSHSDAPYFGIAEWSVGSTTDEAKWSVPIREGLAIPRCRFFSIYENVVGSDVFHRSPNTSAVTAVKSVQKEVESNTKP